MAATLSLKEVELPGDPDTLTSEIRDPAVLNAARHLIGRYRAGQTFDINAFDVPHRALAEIAEKLESAGVGLSMSQPLIEALRRYVMASGGSFSRAVNAKPVVIRMVVSDQMPDCRFESGMTELACLGSGEVRVEGSSSINVRATPTGTAMTSNAADVDAMFSHVKGLNLWIRFEAPTRADMDSLMTSMEATLAGVAQSVGGSLSADDLKKLLAKLEQDGVLTPAVLDLVSKMISLQEGLASGDMPSSAVQSLIQDINALIKDGVMENMLPPALVQAALMSLMDFSSNDMIKSLLAQHGIEGIVADNDNALHAEDASQEMGADILAVLEELAQQIADGTIDMDDLPPELASLIDQMGGVETLLQAEGREARIELLAQALMDDGASPLAETLQAAIIAMTDAGQLASLPPETLKLLETFVKDNPAIVEIAVTNTMVRSMAELLSTMDADSPEAAEIAKAIELLKQDGFAALLDKNIQSVLPPEATKIIQDFAEKNPAAIEIAATSAFLSGMESALGGLDPASPEAAELADLIEQIKEQGLTDFLEGNPDLSPDAALIVENLLKNEGGTGLCADLVGGGDGPETFEGPDGTGDIPPVSPPDPVPAENPGPVKPENKGNDKPDQKPDAGPPAPPEDKGPKPAPDKKDPPEAQPKPDGGPTKDTGSEPLKVKGPCGDGICNCFNEAAKIERKGNEIVFTNKDGTQQTYNVEEATKLIRAEITEGYGVDKVLLDKIIEKNGGDIVEARKVILAEAEAENRFVNGQKGRETDLDDPNGDDAIRRQREMFTPTPPRSSDVSNPTGLKKPWDDCGCGKDHGTPAGKAPAEGPPITPTSPPASYTASSIDPKKGRSGFKGRFKSRSAPEPTTI